MEPEGEPLTPGTSYGPASTPTTQNDTVQQRAPCSPSGGEEELMHGRRLSSNSGDNGLSGEQQTRGPLARDGLSSEQTRGPLGLSEQQARGPLARDGLSSEQQARGPLGLSEQTRGPLGLSSEQTRGPLGLSEQTRGPLGLSEQTRGPLGPSEQTRGPLARPDPGRTAQRAFRPSAFPSSLAWDSDSEKETIDDEEELQHFSNPHGLAAHSPGGSPSSGLRPESEGDQAPDKRQPSPSDGDKPSLEEGRSQNHGSTVHTEDPNAAQRSAVEPADGKAWNVSESSAEPFLPPTKVQPKEGCQKIVNEEEEERGRGGDDNYVKTQSGGSTDAKDSERDVYSFPGDSDPESPPPAPPWAHCTFIQRRRKKRALLRPFSGLGTWQQRTAPEAGRPMRAGPPQSSPPTAEAAQLGEDAGDGDYDFEEMDLRGAGAGSGSVKLKEEEEGGVLGEEVGGSGQEEEEDGGKEIFTCVECSIYFNKQVHLQEHMAEHCQSGSGGAAGGAGAGAGRRDRLAKNVVRFRCVECGWNLPNGPALADHRRKHQESREKILEEIGKLNDTDGNGKAAESQREESVGATEPVTQQVPPAPAKGPDTVLVSTTPVRSPGPSATTLDLDAVVLDSSPSPLPTAAPTPTPAPSARPRAGPSHRRRFVCPKCNFSTRTSQALANHTKTHNRKPPPVPPPPPHTSSPDMQSRFPSVASSLRGARSPSGLASSSTSLARTTGHLKQRQNTARHHHPGQPSSVSGVWPHHDDMGQQQHSRSSTTTDPPAFSNSFLDSSDRLSAGSGTTSLPEGKISRHGIITAAEEDCSVLEHQKPPNVAVAARPARELHAFKCIGNRRKATKREGDSLDEVVRLRPRQSQGSSNSLSEEGNTPPQPLDSELSLKHTDSSPAGLRPHTRARSNLDGSSVAQQQSDDTSSSPEEEKKKVKEEEEDSEVEEEEDPKVYNILRRSSRVLAASLDNGDGDGDDDDVDDEQLRRFLAEEGILDEDEGDFDQESESGSLTSVERRCPYCPERFHNGIGLANHVRGHLNRVGVSYNVRHFISPEEVNAIEKKFSYQKKKKKVANFDPDTFSVMRCEFCSAGFDTRAGLSSHARAHLRDFGITNWEVTISPIHILRELFSSRPDLVIPTSPPRSPGSHRTPREDEGEEEEDEEEEEAEEEDEEMGTEQDKKESADGKRLAELSRRAQSAAASASPLPWRSENHKEEPPAEPQEEGVEEEEEKEEVEEEEDGVSCSNTGTKGPLSQDPDHPSPRDQDDADVKDPDLLKCAVCGARFETRRGLSSHARSHLRQLGISVSESSGAPIDLLYQITKERANGGGGMDGHFTAPLAPPRTTPSAKNPAAMHNNNEEAEPQEADFEEKPIHLSVLHAKAAKGAPPSSSSSSTPTPCPSPGGVSPRRPPSAPLRPASPSPPVVRKAPISSLLPMRSPDHHHKAGGIKSLASSIATTKPFWAPQECDAPLNLTLEVDPNKDIICQLCGAWFETRKGLSSHARAHLRHFGVEYSESKGSPIDLLNQLIHTDDFKHNVSTLQADAPKTPPGLAAALAASPSPKLLPPSHSLLLTSTSGPSPSPLLYKMTTSRGGGGGSPSKVTSSSSSSASSLSLLGHHAPPAKRPKSSAMQVFRLSSGELMALPHSEPPKEIGCEFCGEYFENRKGLSSHARSHLRQMGITEWSVNGSPIDTLREVITRRGLPCALPLKPHHNSSRRKTPPPPSSSAASSARSPPPLSSPPSPRPTLLGRLPFGFARPSSPAPPQPTGKPRGSSPSPSSGGGLVVKMKPEPVQMEVTTMSPGGSGGSAGSGGRASAPLNCSWSGQDSIFPLNLAMTHEAEPTRDIRCEFCGEYFENRKGLSSHARSHLRQMGITEWSVNGSPIDTLREIMHKREGGGRGGTSSPSDQRVKKESSGGQQGGAGSPAWESLEGQRVSSYQSAKYRKSPLSLLHSGSRLHKQGLSGLSLNPSSGKFFRVSQLGKRPLAEEETTAQSPSHHVKTFSPLPHDYSFKRKSSPDKHGAGHQDASCELCGFYFENRKALASHARAHLRQFGVTEWCVNGSPIETLSAWMKSRPQKVVEMHRSYMQGSRSTPKKKSSSPLSPTSDPDHILSLSSSSSHKPSSSSSSSSGPWSAVALSLVQGPLGLSGASQGSSRTTEGGAGGIVGNGGGGGSSSLQVPSSATRPGHGRIPSPAGGRQSNSTLLLGPQAQVARSELNVRLPRGFERRPLKHGEERDSGSPKPPRSSTIPSLVPKPPSYPLVKLVGKFYTLKCRFCEVEFHGPLSVQEDWIRHLQQHILKMNYNKPAAPKAPPTTSSSSSSSSAPAVEERDRPKAPTPAPTAAPAALTPGPPPASTSTSTSTCSSSSASTTTTTTSVLTSSPSSAAAAATTLPLSSTTAAAPAPALMALTTAAGAPPPPRGGSAPSSPAVPLLAAPAAMRTVVAAAEEEEEEEERAALLTPPTPISTPPTTGVVIPIPAPAV